MNKFKTLAAIAASTIAIGGSAATTASAQPWHQGYSNGRHYDNRLTTSYVDGLQWKINNAARQGVISWPAARDLRAQLRSVQPLAYRVENGSARPWEVQRLQAVVNRIDSLTSGYAYNARRPYDR
jgi:hypothetical protein